MGFMSPDMPEDTAAADEAKRQGRIKAGMADIDKTFGQFDPTFYGNRARAYTEWGVPQVDDQYKEAADQLKYALVRQYGTTQTSEAAKRQALLARKYTEARTGVAQSAEDYASQAKADVERERNALVSQLQSTADPEAAAQAAVKSSELLQAPKTYSPLGSLFSDVTAGLASGASPYGTLDYAGQMYRKATGASKSPVSVIPT